jgi:hypothetical protein
MVTCFRDKRSSRIPQRLAVIESFCRRTGGAGLKQTKDDQPLPEVADEPGWQERFQRGLQRALNTPPAPRVPKAKERPASKGSVHKGKT